VIGGLLHAKQDEFAIEQFCTVIAVRDGDKLAMRWTIVNCILDQLCADSSSKAFNNG
jgi:hypothetical protein